MTVTAGDGGTEPGLQAGRLTTRTPPMPTRRRWLACGVAQFVLLAAAGWATDARREWDRPAWWWLLCSHSVVRGEGQPPPPRLPDVVTRGWPVVWAATDPPEFRASAQRSHHWRHNRPVPVALGLLAAGVPAAGLAPAGRGRAAGRVAAVAGLAGLLAAAGELETARDATEAGYGFAPSAPLRDREAPVNPVHRWAISTRQRLFADSRETNDTVGGLWRRRTLLTAWAMLCGGGAAAVWWKPWRHPPAATTPPAA